MDRRMQGILTEKGWKIAIDEVRVGRSSSSHGNSGPSVALDLLHQVGNLSADPPEYDLTARLFVSADDAVELAELLLLWSDISRKNQEGGWSGSEEAHIANAIKPIVEKLKAVGEL